jgi:holo-[acyl-carrier protein] synthase
MTDVEMIYSTGIDLVDINRIRQGYKAHGDRYLNRFYSRDEINQIRSRRANMIATMAGRFAAKEAVIKCLGLFFDSGVTFRDVEVLNLPGGRPYVRLPERLNDKMEGKKILISISHEKQMAVAMAIIVDVDK